MRLKSKLGEKLIAGFNVQHRVVNLTALSCDAADDAAICLDIDKVKAGIVTRHS